MTTIATTLSQSNAAGMSRLRSRRLSQLAFAVIIFSCLIDVSLLKTWREVNNGFHDSDWLMFYHAAERARDGVNPYLVSGEFRNPPPFLLLARASLTIGYIPSRILWSIISTLLLLGAGALVAMCLPIRPSNGAMVRGAILILSYSPTILLIPTAANSTAPVVASYALALWCFVRGYDTSGGAVLSVSMLVKPQLAFLTLPLLVYKRRWRAVAGYLGCAAVSLAISLIALGPQLLGQFIDMLRSTSTGADSLSLWIKDIPGLHAMFLQIWPGSTFAGLVAYALSAVLVIALAWYWRGAWSPTSARFIAGWAMVPLVDLLAVPYSHSDDLVLLIIPAVVLYGFTLRPARSGSVYKWIVPVLLALYLSPTLVAYFRLHFVAPVMLAALYVLWRLSPMGDPAPWLPTFEPGPV